MNHLYTKTLFWTATASRLRKQCSWFFSLEDIWFSPWGWEAEELDGIIFLRLQEIVAVGLYSFHAAFVFAVRRLEQLNCLPIDCDHWFCGSSVVCGAPDCLHIDCVLQEVAGKETVAGCRAHRGFKVRGFRQIGQNLAPSVALSCVCFYKMKAIFKTFRQSWTCRCFHWTV